VVSTGYHRFTPSRMSSGSEWHIELERGGDFGLHNRQ